MPARLGQPPTGAYVKLAGSPLAPARVVTHCPVKVNLDSPSCCCSSQACTRSKHSVSSLQLGPEAKQPWLEVRVNRMLQLLSEEQMPLRKILCLFWVLVRKRWSPALGQRPLENTSFRKGQVLSMSRKTPAREIENMPLVSTKL